MKIIFISSVCDRADYEEICRKRKHSMLDSSQKFFEMFVKGLAQQPDVTVDCITLRPLSRSTYPGFYIPGQEIQQQNICYHYVPVWNFPVLKSLMGMASIRAKLRSLLRRYQESQVRIICDPLLLEGLQASTWACRKYGVTTAGFLTDLPDYADECDGHAWWKKLLYQGYNRIVKNNLGLLDRYILLTEPMCYVAEGKPWLLLDCIVDESMLNGLEPLQHADGLPHVLYAGKLHKEFGLDLLAEAIPLVKQNCVFDIYGDGNYLEELKELAQKQSNVRLHGIVPLVQVLRAELAAKVLINPRTSAGKFTKYSFPSKTAEYMLAGVPVVMFRLPGISQNYDDLICFVDQETPKTLAEGIDAVLALEEETHRQVGDRARGYVAHNKNNGVQAARVVKFLE